MIRHGGESHDPGVTSPDRGSHTTLCCARLSRAPAAHGISGGRREDTRGDARKHWQALENMRKRAVWSRPRPTADPPSRDQTRFRSPPSPARAVLARPRNQLLRRRLRARCRRLLRCRGSAPLAAHRAEGSQQARGHTGIRETHEGGDQGAVTQARGHSRDGETRGQPHDPRTNQGRQEARVLKCILEIRQKNTETQQGRGTRRHGPIQTNPPKRTPPTTAEYVSEIFGEISGDCVEWKRDGYFNNIVAAPSSHRWFQANLWQARSMK